MDGYDGRGSRTPDGDTDWPGGGDPADEWILDPVTGEYRMRLPGERPPDPEPSWRSRQEPSGGESSSRRREPSVGAELELRSTRTQLVPVAGSRAASRTASRAAARGNDRRSRRGGRRRNSSGGGLWLAGTLGIVGLLGCGTGGYLLLHGNTSRTAYCSSANASASAAPVVSPHQTGPTLAPGPSAQPINVRVTILDGSGQFGEAEAVLSWMQITQLYTRTSNGGPVTPRATTSLVYAPNHTDQARTLAAAMHLPPSALHGTGTGTGLRSPMILTLGKDFRGPGKPLATPPAPPTPSPSTAGCSR